MYTSINTNIHKGKAIYSTIIVQTLVYSTQVPIVNYAPLGLKVKVTSELSCFSDLVPTTCRREGGFLLTVTVTVNWTIRQPTNLTKIY